MPRPPAAAIDATVDATLCANTASRIERHFAAFELPRLEESGARGSTIQARFQFSLLDSLPAIDGELNGSVLLTCQRCMKDVTIEVQERFQIVIVREERNDDPAGYELSGYEQVMADPARLDLRWLAEDQLLLALPLVPMHRPDECSEAAAERADGDARQKPFQNLRDLLRPR